MPTLYLLVGLPGAGKSTLARRLEAEVPALVLSADEWILALHGPALSRDERGPIRDRLEAHLWHLAARALILGLNVVLDWGFWPRAERDRYRTAAHALGAQVETIFLDVPIDILWERISARPDSLEGTFAVTREELELWVTWFEPSGR